MSFCGGARCQANGNCWCAAALPRQCEQHYNVPAARDASASAIYTLFSLEHKCVYTSDQVIWIIRIPWSKRRIFDIFRIYTIYQSINRSIYLNIQTPNSEIVDPVNTGINLCPQVYHIIATDLILLYNHGVGLRRRHRVHRRHLEDANAKARGMAWHGSEVVGGSGHGEWVGFCVAHYIAPHYYVWRCARVTQHTKRIHI